LVISARLLGLSLAAAAVAWFGVGELVRFAQARRLPSLPAAGAVPEAVRNRLVAADRAARRQPTSAGAAGALGIAYHGSLLPGQAHHAYALAEALAPDDWRWTYYRGLLFEEHGEHAAAAAAFDRVTAADANQGLAWFRRAEIAFKEGQLAQADAGYRRAREAPAPLASASPRPTPALAAPLAAYASFGLARVASERGEREEARRLLTQLLKEHPRFAPARTLQWRLAEDAEPAAQKPDASGAYVPPADPLLDAIVAQSSHSDLLLKHAALAARSGDRAWRELLARRALTANPSGLDVLLEMASVAQAAGRHTEALEYLRRCEKVAPGDHHTLVEQGKSLAELGRLDEAEQVLRRAIRVRDAAAEYNLGTVLDRMDRWEEARRHYEEALAIDPFHARALNNLAVGLDRRGRTQESLPLFARALQAAPANADTYSNLGSALIQQRRFEEAIEALTTAIALDPDAPDAHNNLGIALAQSGRIDEARREFLAALERFPQHVNARRNLAQLDARK
jgi:tetratricopeptide (TPR) repeat protein